MFDIAVALKQAHYTALLNAVEHSVHLHGPYRLPVVNYFSIMCSSSSPVTYQPQRIWLLSDVNVFGRLFLC